MGLTEFMEWSDRIIAGAVLPECISVDDQRYALADMIMHLGPSESHKCDAHFIHYLRKVVVNQVAHAFKQEHYAKKKEPPKDEMDEDEVVRASGLVRAPKTDSIGSGISSAQMREG